MYHFGLAAEFGDNSEKALQFSNYFKGYTILTEDEQKLKCTTEVKINEDRHWVLVTPEDVGMQGSNTPENAIFLTEIGIKLYEKLITAPDFRFASVGVQIDQFITYENLLESAYDSGVGYRAMEGFPGLVIDLGTWDRLGRPLDFTTFDMNHVWKPYAGEIYQPLYLEPHLTRLWNQLDR